MHMNYNVRFDVDDEMFCEICEKDFYPPEDDRLFFSLVEDVDGGDCFDDYSEYFWSVYENHLFDCNN